ncbi:MAG: OsmC family protein [Phycisphaerales bacterium]|nr:OsmC family protein [Phycisphaerales bacterium]
MPGTAIGTINGVDTDALAEAIRQIKSDPTQGQTSWEASTRWTGGLQSETSVTGWTLAGERKPHSFTLRIDEPRELCGKDEHANPQEYLMAALNACMMNTFVAVCSLQGVTLESLTVECEGDIDLRGFLGIDTRVPAGYESIRYRIRVKGDGTPEQYAKAHQAMIATSPNYYNLSRAVPLEPELIVE